MEILQILATAILQGVGFTLGVLIVVAVIGFGVKRKVMKTKLSVFDLFKLAKLRGNKNG